jgi:GT2 family glycosyltransferase
MLPTIDVIIINWNGSEDTIDCLRSLVEQDYNGVYRAIVIDNSSIDASIPNIIDWCRDEKVHLTRYDYDSINANFSEHSVVVREVDDKSRLSVSLICADTNLGFCVANNAGVEHSITTGGDLSLILNNDTVCENNFLSAMADASSKFGHKSILSPQICYEASPDTVWWNGGIFTKWLTPKYVNQGENVVPTLCEYSATEWVSGCATLIPNDIYKELGLYDPVFFIWCDEWDFSLRLNIKKLDMQVVHGARVYHKVGKSLGIVSPLVFFYSFRNMSILRKRYLSRSKFTLFNAVYVPYKLLQSFVYSLKQKDYRYLLAYYDVLKDGVGSGYGKWCRQKH